MDHPQPDISIRRYDNVYVSDHARAVVGDAHYHIQIRDDQLESDDILGKIDVGEIQTVSSLAWKLYKSCKSDPDAFSNIPQDLSSLRAVLEECEEIFPHVTKPAKRARRLKTIIDGCNDNLGQLEAIVVRYNNLAVRQRWTWQRMGESSMELQEIRGRITSQMSMLTAFMSTSQFYVEQRLEEMRREFREGHMEGSVMSSLTIDSLTVDARAQWRVVRKELENHGISLAMFDANKDFIYHWIERAIERGAFEEEGQSEIDNKGSCMKVFINNPALTDAEDDSGDDPTSLKSFQAAAGSSRAFERDPDPPQPQGHTMITRECYNERPTTAQENLRRTFTIIREPVRSANQLSIAPADDCRADNPLPGTLKLYLSMSYSTTTTKPPQFIRQEIIRVLEHFNIPHVETRGGFICENKNRWRYALMFEVAIHNIPLGTLYGIQFRKVNGDENEYHELTISICRDLQL